MRYCEERSEFLLMSNLYLNRHHKLCTQRTDYRYAFYKRMVGAGKSRARQAVQTENKQHKKEENRKIDLCNLPKQINYEKEQHIV